MADPMRQDRDLVLPPSTFAFVLDQTKGHVTTWVGPTRTSLSNTDQLVSWTGKKFAPISDLTQAVQPFVKATESQYVVLTDPAENEPEKFPGPGTSTTTANLDAGKKVVIPGPTTFALWPGQTAEVIDGHHLSYNEYLVVQVYEPEAARANQARAIAAPSAGDDTKKKKDEPALEYTMGERQVIRGTHYSYYVPPTGIEVVPETEGTKVSYVRSAATLEQLEYCVLVDEDGTKRYEQGPAVVFPEPTETFTMESGSRKFRALELNPQSGLYIKVVADYKNGIGKLSVLRGAEIVQVAHDATVKAGDELFLTGADVPIYFPSAEHFVIHYGKQRKHYASAVPKGEGRYILNKVTGEVDLIVGPTMLLADPRYQVEVRRVLEADAVNLLYPGNNEAQQINSALRSELVANAEDYLPVTANYASASLGESGSLARSYKASTEFAGEQMRRGTEYTPPRSITLDTKYQGAVSVSVWPGYAVLVMNKSGNRRVEVGPANILLKYDESLMAMSLSTGKPKNTDSLYKTPYLRTVNNQVSDIVTVETRDLVPVQMKLSYRVNFEGVGDARLKWFDVENYVKVLTDHCRSKLRSVARRHDIQAFYGQTIDYVRDALLGSSTKGTRTGLTFEENGMRLIDVEVLTVVIDDPSVGQMLSQATQAALSGAIQLSTAEAETARYAELSKLERQRIAESQTTAEAQATALLAQITREREAELERLATKVKAAEERARESEVLRLDAKTDTQQSQALDKAQNDIDLAREHEEATIYEARMAATSDKLIVALQTLGDQSLMERLAKEIGPGAAASGTSIVDILAKTLEGTTAGDMAKELARRPIVERNY